MCSQRALTYGQNPEQLGFGLEMLAIESVAQDPAFVDFIVGDDPLNEVDFTEWHAGGSGDGGIDGILYSEDLQNVAIIQTKFKKTSMDAATIEEARSFFSSVGEWSDVSKRDQYNPVTQRLLDESQLNPKRQQVDLYFITSMPASEIDHVGIAETHTSQHLEAGRNVNCKILTQAEFLELIDNTGDALFYATVPEVSLQIPEGDFILQESGPHRILVGVIKGQELESLYNRKDVRNRLFNTNVRAALSTGKVNPKIQETASSKDTGKMFLYFNNGVTATCSRLDVQKSSFTAADFQVVNGAQTVAALAKALKRNPNPDVKVLLRVIETDKYSNKSKVADQITRFQNTQNPVKASDFFSNDPFQIWLSSLIDKNSGKHGFPATWYEHKRGVRTSQSTTGRRKLGIEQLATLRFACVKDAPFTYKTPKDIWNGENDNANYWLAFGRDGEQIETWNEEEQDEVAWMIRTWFSLRDTHRTLNKEKSENSERTYLGVLARYVTALAFHLMTHLQRKGTGASFRALLAGGSESELQQKLVLKVCRSVVRDSLRDDWNGRSANPRLSMPQDSDTWAKSKQKVVEDYAFEVENA
jgi:hypothetical protein